jgi:general secretion pathway protein G
MHRPSSSCLQKCRCPLSANNSEGSRKVGDIRAIKIAVVSQWLRSPATPRATGFTIVELLIVIAVILTIAAIAVPNLLAAINRAKIARAVGDIHTIGTAVLGYEAGNQRCPDTLSQVGYGATLDPWGQPYQYLNFANTQGKGAMRKDRFLVPINSDFDLYSIGPDGESVPPLTASVSKDDVIWANDGSFVGLASDY